MSGPRHRLATGGFCATKVGFKTGRWLLAQVENNIK